MVVATKGKNGARPENVRELDITIIDPHEIVFDPSKISTFDLEDINAAEKELRYRDIARLLINAVVRLPDGWGDPHDVESYRRPLPEWRAIIKAYLKAATDTGE